MGGAVRVCTAPRMHCPTLPPPSGNITKHLSGISFISQYHYPSPHHPHLTSTVWFPATVLTPTSRSDGWCPASTIARASSWPGSQSSHTGRGWDGAGRGTDNATASAVGRVWVACKGPMARGWEWDWEWSISGCIVKRSKG